MHSFTVLDNDSMSVLNYDLYHWILFCSIFGSIYSPLPAAPRSPFAWARFSSIGHEFKRFHSAHGLNLNFTSCCFRVLSSEEFTHFLRSGTLQVAPNLPAEACFSTTMSRVHLENACGPVQADSTGQGYFFGCATCSCRPIRSYTT
ncbi:hypothetical protein K474DRAFT_1041850 [Panus rudis PR-1116 ss-1]|nr:hypothetical protein K474DRAFT_1041850 [Panus rudis PR-1116 ss-1]